MLPESGTLVARKRPQSRHTASPHGNCMSHLRACKFLVFEIVLQFILWGNRASGGDLGKCSCGGSSSCAVSCGSQGTWFVADSPNFQVCCLQSASQARLVAHHCETVRKELVATWGGGAQPWNPRCQLVLHPNAPSYLRAVGKGGEATLASTLVKRSRDKVATRRIDLRSDVKDYLAAALPHEMCHVALADHLPQAPLWFDEGVALLSDPISKQRLHERDLKLGLQRGTTFPLSELLAMDKYPSADRWGVFYGQSASLVRYLLKRGSAEDLIRFVKLNEEIGPNLALRETYGIDGLQTTEAHWQRNAFDISGSVQLYEGLARPQIAGVWPRLRDIASKNRRNPLDLPGGSRRIIAVERHEPRIPQDSMDRL